MITSKQQVCRLAVAAFIFSFCAVYQAHAWGSSEVVSFDSYRDNPDYRPNFVGKWTQETTGDNYRVYEFSDTGTGIISLYEKGFLRATTFFRYKTSATHIMFGYDDREPVAAKYTFTPDGFMELSAFTNNASDKKYRRDNPMQTPPTAVGNKDKDVGTIELALANAAATLMSAIPKDSVIAIINISSNDDEVANFVAQEVEFILVSNRFAVVDRGELDKLRKEQQFHLSGEVDDVSAVSIGKFAGANIVMVGSITGSGSMRRLRLRAIDTQTARVIGAASEAF